MIGPCPAALAASKLPAVKWKTRTDLIRLLIWAKEQIEAKPARRQSLSALAARAGLSRFHFHRLFRQAFGCTPTQCRHQARIERAKTLVRSSACSLSEAALEVGFESLSAFSRAFRRETGLSPSQFRNIGKASYRRR